MPDRKRRFAGQDAGQLTVKLFLLLRRQAGPQFAIRGGRPEAGEFSVLTAWTASPRPRRARPPGGGRPCALTFGFELAVRNCRSRGGGTRLKGRA